MAVSSEKPSLWVRALRRATTSEDEQQAEDLRHQAQAAGVQTIAQCPLRTSVHLRGTITVVTLNPRDGHRWLEAEFSDGTGTVSLLWMGRRIIPGIDAGRRVDVSGFLTLHQGRKVIFNPRYALLNA